jgi:hypothetical protein
VFPESADQMPISGRSSSPPAGHLHELVDNVFQHRDAGCQVCVAGSPPCPKVQKAIAVAVEWRDARIVLSRAKWERSRQRLVEFEQELDELLASERAA